jgi:hypothetical protein
MVVELSSEPPNFSNNHISIKDVGSPNPGAPIGTIPLDLLDIPQRTWTLQPHHPSPLKMDSSFSLGCDLLLIIDLSPRLYSGDGGCTNHP